MSQSTSSLIIISVLILIGTAVIRFGFTTKDLQHEKVANQLTTTNLADIQDRQGKIREMTAAKEGEKKVKGAKYSKKLLKEFSRRGL